MSREVEYCWSIIFVIVLSLSGLQAQDYDDVVDCCRTTIYVSEAYGGERSEWSVPGLSIDYRMPAGNMLDILLRSHILRWSDARQSTLSVNIGPSTLLSQSGSWMIDMYFVGGTVGIAGSDYAGFFGHLEVGTTFSKYLANGHALRFNLSGHEGMAFHPSSYFYGQLSVGYSL